GDLPRRSGGRPVRPTGSCRRRDPDRPRAPARPRGARRGGRVVHRSPDPGAPRRPGRGAGPVTGRLLPVVGALVVFVAAWKAIVLVGGYPPFILPPPEAVAARFVSAWSGGLIVPHAAATLVEVAAGFAVGATTAVAA